MVEETKGEEETQPKKTYASLHTEKSDINEHLPTLMELAKECQTVLECGVRGVVSSYAFAEGLFQSNEENVKLYLNDINACNIEDLRELYEEDVEFIECWQNDLTLDIEADMIFIDTFHIYEHLRRELKHFKDKAKKYIVLHDTEVDGLSGESVRMKETMYDVLYYCQEVYGCEINDIQKGLRPAIDEFLMANKEWVLHKHYENNNGLTILKRV